MAAEDEATVVSLQHQDGNLWAQRPDRIGTVQIVFRPAGGDALLIPAAVKDSGDSGAPVVQNDLLIGVLSGGRMPAGVPMEKLNCKDFSGPEVLSVYRHREWIKRATAELRSRQAPPPSIRPRQPGAAVRLPTAEELSARLAD